MNYRKFHIGMVSYTVITLLLMIGEQLYYYGLMVRLDDITRNEILYTLYLVSFFNKFPFFIILLVYLIYFFNKGTTTGSIDLFEKAD